MRVSILERLAEVEFFRYGNAKLPNLLRNGPFFGAINVRYQVIGVASGLWLSLAAITTGQSPAEPAVKSPAEQTSAAAPNKVAPNNQPVAEKAWKSLIPKSGLEGWEITDFGGQGEVIRKESMLVLEMGEPLTGINYKKKDFPTNNFEIELEAQRIEGNDFLCGLTFPVGKEFCSFIAGGWGGGVVGLSNVDGYDASENSTSTYHKFENGQWYKFRVAVDDEMIRGWIDDESFFQQEREHHEFSTRIEVYVCQPLGLCAFQSKVAIRNFRWRPIKSGSPTTAAAPEKP
jgi:hypothetical protein